MLYDYGWNDRLAAAYAALAEKECKPGRVIAVHRNAYKVVGEEGVVNAKVSGRFRYQAQQKADFPAIGDWVIISKAFRDNAIIVSLLPRQSVFARKLPIQGGRKMKRGLIEGGSTEEQVIAANLDTLFIVVGLDQNFDVRRLERYLTLAFNGGARPVILLNKADLHECVDAYTRQVASIAPQVPVHCISALQGTNMRALHAYLEPTRTVAFIGSSGVGKSTLINALLEEAQLTTNDISSATGKGKHTTTSAELVMHPSGCMIIDTPGLRELQLWGDESGLEVSFADILHLSTQCQYRGCTHKGERGCAIKGALEEGTLSKERLASYHKQQRELVRLQEKKKQLEKRRNKR